MMPFVYFLQCTLNIFLIIQNRLILLMSDIRHFLTAFVLFVVDV